MADLDARDARRAASVDKGFGELFTFTAMVAAADVNLPKAVDGSKPALTNIPGVWENFSDAMFPRARGSNPDDDVTQRAVGQPSVIVSKAYLTAWTPERGTRLTRLKDGAVYEVAKALPHDRGRVLFLLSARMKP